MIVILARIMLGEESLEDWERPRSGSNSSSNTNILTNWTHIIHAISMFSQLVISTHIDDSAIK